ncbi:MAG TPA: 4'-phosphopantetheinyl transferase superfamily protein [Vicinamibacterales bacterium]|nr:4'-phosphopantetheinyl transferase superfamily protein [Vicinamibacterales bacterium]
MPAAASWPSPSIVEVFVADIAGFRDSRERMDEAQAWLTEDEQTRASRFRRDDDRAMFTLGRYMARTVVGRALDVAPAAWPWRQGPHGRPEIDAAGTDLHFNLSHSAGVVICALARGRSVGVDVEHLGRRAFELTLVDRYCSPSEAEDVCEQGKDWRDRFLVYWTLKEAYLKARGLGISVPLSDISFTLIPSGAEVAFERSLAGTDARWKFHLWQAGDRHVAAVAVETTDNAIPTFHVQAF